MNLLLKSALGLIFLLSVLALALFLPAGTLLYWQGWLYLAVFGGSSLAITLYLLRYDPHLLASRVQAGPTAEVRLSQKIIQSLAGLAFISVFVMAGLDQRWHWSNLPSWLNLLGTGAVALGFWIVLRVFKANTYTSSVIEVVESQRVIETGPYAWVRHPMYAGAAVLILASAPALGSWWVLIPALLLQGVIIMRLLDEEKYLSGSLEGYSDYCHNVRYRLIPGVW